MKNYVLMNFFSQKILKIIMMKIFLEKKDSYEKIFLMSIISPIGGASQV